MSELLQVPALLPVPALLQVPEAARIFELFQPFVPRPGVAFQAGGAGLLFGLAAGIAAVRARTGPGLRVPDTRKIFHFLVFSGALGVHLLWGAPGTAVYGSVIAGMVFVSVLRGVDDPLFESLARPTDAPRRGTFVVVPLLATAVGGVASNLFWGDFATVGYLVAGWGDAIAEPVGTRWGKHRYRVPSFGGVSAERSLAGSAAVLVAGWLGAAAALSLLGIQGWRVVGVAAVCAVVATALEAVSHHGLDNLTLQVAASWTAAAFLP
ncbi:MAG: hypothetical protein ACLFWG_09470 [Longimicrobiales bacterium]